jgi:hypothetical protein
LSTPPIIARRGWRSRARIYGLEIGTSVVTLEAAAAIIRDRLAGPLPRHSADSQRNAGMPGQDVEGP